MRDDTTTKDFRRSVITRQIIEITMRSSMLLSSHLKRMKDFLGENRLIFWRNYNSFPPKWLSTEIGGDQAVQKETHYYDVRQLPRVSEFDAEMEIE